MKFVLSFLLCLIYITSFSQKNVAFTIDNFQEQKKELAAARAAIEEGDYYFDLGSKYIKKALQEYLKAYHFNPNEADLNYKIGLCHISAKTEKQKAANYFKKAKRLKANVNPMINYFLGKSFQIQLKFDSAIAHYQFYLKEINGKDEKEMNQTKRLIDECNFGKEQIGQPRNVQIFNIGERVNSIYPDYDPVISSDNSILLFTSRREGLGGEIDGELNEYFEDVWVSYKENGKWTKAKNLGPPINTKMHDAVVGLSPDGQRLLIYRNGDIFQSFQDRLEWSKPKKLVKAINSDAHESSASYSFNDQQLYFISERAGGQGEKDIWVSHWNEEEWTWNEPINLGGTINTAKNEETVFAHPDGRTLYFSSEGHLGMGGYDIFKSELQDDGKWGKPENLGYPINSPDEDVSFVLAADGTHGYYSSANEKSIGQRDIFEITFLEPEEKLTADEQKDSLNLSKSIASSHQLHTSKASIFKGAVSDMETGKPIAAKIEIYNNDTGELVLSSKSNSVSGKFLMALPANANYNIAIKAEGHLFHSENFFVPATGVYEEVVKNISLKPLKVGAAIVLNNIFFDHNESTLHEVSKVELLNIQELMKNNKKLKVEVSGHTDNSGAESYNQKLSEDRAKAVIEYLKSKGIETNRMSYVGYGETKPIADNSTEDGQQLNRRTEIQVTAF